MLPVIVRRVGHPTFLFEGRARAKGVPVEPLSPLRNQALARKTTALIEVVRMIRFVAATACFGVVLIACAFATPGARAQQASKADLQVAGAVQSLEMSAQSRRRRPVTRLRVYRDYRYLPPTAVRACDAWYEQEFRPSGTVIVPRMRCRWVNS